MSTRLQDMVVIFAGMFLVATCRDEAEELSVRHTFTLVMAPVEGTPRSTVYIRLLGPFSARSASPYSPA